VQSSDVQYDRVVGPAHHDAARPNDVEDTGSRVQPEAEYLLVGGGLQNALILLALLDSRPDTRLTLIERDGQLGGNHTWCFHAGDVPERAMRWLAPLIVKRWPAHDVRFPGHRRRLDEEYCAVTSAALHQEVTRRIAAAPHVRLVTGSAIRLGQHSVSLEGGRVLSGRLVVDARGPVPGAAAGGYQKFVGLELQVAPGTASPVPMLMDATVAQLDGFRFVYVLPWDHDRVLIEDTYYSTNPRLDKEALARGILAYAKRNGMPVVRVLREEEGVLPIPTRLDFASRAQSPIQAGYAGGLFHPTTGYSFPIAVRFALHLAERRVEDALGADYQRFLSRHKRQARFCTNLNRLLFDAFAPAERYRVLERFYRLPAPTIRRFYALQTTLADRARILCGRPPAGFSFRRLLSRGDQP
jgi:lycopene beta-cyclase